MYVMSICIVCDIQSQLWGTSVLSIDYHGGVMACVLVNGVKDVNKACKMSDIGINI